MPPAQVGAEGIFFKSCPPNSPLRPLSAFTKRWKLHFSPQKS